MHSPVPFWQSPESTSLGKLPPRARFEPTRQPTAARPKSSLSLDGPWQFHLAPSPDAAEAARAQPASVEWTSIDVPGNFETQGFGQPHYSNIVMPFRLEPPEVPAVNPTGVYRRRFELSSAWQRRRIVIRFEGAASVLVVHCNKTLVGFSKDSCLPAEFDITPYCRFDRTNEITATVIKWSDASYVEDQDQWWLAGLQRSVSIYRTPATYLRDIRFTHRLTNTFTAAKFVVEVELGTQKSFPRQCTVAYRLFDPGGKIVAKSSSAETVVTAYREPTQFGRRRVRFSGRLNRRKLQLWSHETPVLYQLEVELRSTHGVSRARIAVGFRDIRLHDGDLLINGRRVIIKGVNRHDHHPESGKALPQETLEQDVRLIKQSNFNAVRCSHYPCDPRFIDLCDQHGLYVIQEANIESHDFHNELCRETRYATAWLDRCMRMVVTYQNHASIIAWSLGNESGYGPNHDAAAGWIRHYDPDRLLHNEGGISKVQSRLTWAHGAAASDLICPMYASLEEIRQWSALREKHRPTEATAADWDALQERVEALSPELVHPHGRPALRPVPHPLNRPLILCEYSHAMGNSNGSLADYFQLFKTLPGVQGGFIWEWLDHSFYRTDEQGNRFAVYGGDFGDVPNDANFVCDGLVSADRVPHPALAEHKRLAQPMALELVKASANQATLLVRNEHDFLTSDHLVGEWHCLLDGEQVDQGHLPKLKLKPNQNRTVVVPLARLPRSQISNRPVRGERFLNVVFRLSRDTSWAGKGFVVAEAQLELPSTRRVAASNTSRHGTAPQVSETSGSVQLELQDIQAVFQRKSGRLVSLTHAGRLIVSRGPQLELWRAATDNDGLKLWSGQENKALGRWRAAGLDRPPVRKLISWRLEQKPGQAVVISTCHQWISGVSPNHAEHIQRYRFHPDGMIDIDNRVRLVGPGMRDVPRIGCRIDLPGDFNRVRYFGRGPLENYCDRLAASRVDCFDSSVEAEYVDYVMPQEHGHHCDTRWLELSDRDGLALRVVGCPVFEFNASAYRTEDLFTATHTNELIPTGLTHLYLDHCHRGVGTGSCGPETRPEYRIRGRRFRWSYRLQIVD